MESPATTYLSDLSTYLNIQELSEMMSCGKLIRIQKDTNVFEEGESADALYYIVKGKFAAIKRLSNGEEVVIAERTKGAIFGEMGVIEDENPCRSATVKAMEDGEMLELCKSDFDQAIKKGSTWASKLMFLLAKVLSCRLRELTQEYAKLWEECHQKTINEMEAFGTRLTEKWNF